MFHQIVLYLALAVFGIGMILKVSAWFRYSVSLSGSDIPLSRRISAASTGIIRSLFSLKSLRIMKVFWVEVIFQARVLREDFLRWLMHMCIYSGFTMLFFLHALDNLVISRFYPGYAATLNPFLFLKDLGGAMIVLGIALAVYRRFIRRRQRPITSRMDVNAMIMVTLIIVSGFLLEGAKISSKSDFDRMAEEYTVMADSEEIKALESYWVQNFGTVSPGMTPPFDTALLEKGKTAHDMSCAQCHSNPQWGFGGYAVSIAMRPVASLLDRAGSVTFLTWLHYLSALLFLAYLPFSKMFHIFASPLSLLVNSAMEGSQADPANIATRQMIELDGCTHCGACTLRCSVAVAVHEIPNMNIFPSEKIASLKRLAAGKILDPKEIRTIQQGIVLCTNCDRCSIACPSGIHLRDLWFSARERLLKNSIEEYQLLSPLAFYRGLQKEAIKGDDYHKPLALALHGISGGVNGTGKGPLKVGEKELLGKLNGSIQAHSLLNCYRCGICTNSCPVVHNYARPAEVLGLLPHQMMHAIGLRCWDLVFSSKMLWDCLGCYQCQDNCPQCVAVTDIIYELKNRAISRKYDELAA